MEGPHPPGVVQVLKEPARGWVARAVLVCWAVAINDVAQRERVLRQVRRIRVAPQTVIGTIGGVEAVASGQRMRRTA